MISFTSLFAVTLVLLLIWRYVKYYRRFSKFPSVSSVPIFLKSLMIPDVSERSSVNSFLLRTLKDVCERFSNEGMCLFWFFEPCLVIFNENAIKLFNNDSSALKKPSVYKSIFQGFFGTGLLTSEGDLWKKRRKMFNPLFYSSNLKWNVSTMNKNGIRLVEELMRIPDKSSVDITTFLKCTAFSNIYEFIIGKEVNNSQDGAEVQYFIDFINRSTEFAVYSLFRPWLHYKFMQLFSSRGRQYLRHLNKRRQFLTKILEKKMVSVYDETSKKQKEKHGIQEGPRRSFCELLIEYHIKDPSFSLKDMTDELCTFMSAGYDTVSYGLMWCLFLLGHHPDVQEQVYNEVEAVMESVISYEDLDKLSYLDCVIKETLRLYPSIPVYIRCLQKDIQCGEYLVPKNTNIVVFTYLSQRNPAVYPDPEKFDPERFSAGHSEKKLWNYTPFAEGIRSCIGKNFALMEMKIVLAHLIKNFKITSMDRREDIVLTWEIILSTIKPLHFHLSPRE